MRTIETEAAITDSGTLVVATPPDMRLGVYRVVVVIDEQLATIQTAQIAHEDPWDTLARIGGQLSAQGPLPGNAVEELAAARR